MYTKEQASKIRESFWKAFGQYMALQPSAEGIKTNWINYRTGIRHLNFRMDADKKLAYVAISFSHPDKGIRALMVEQLKQLQPMLEQYLEGDWYWLDQEASAGSPQLSMLRTDLHGFNIYRQEDWVALVRFFKQHITALDAFWCDAKYAFELFS